MTGWQWIHTTIIILIFLTQTRLFTAIFYLLFREEIDHHAILQTRLSSIVNYDGFSKSLNLVGNQ